MLVSIYSIYCILILACVKLLFNGFIDKISNSCGLNIHLNLTFGVSGYLFPDVATDVNENLLLSSRGPRGLMS